MNFGEELDTAVRNALGAWNVTLYYDDVKNLKTLTVTGVRDISGIGCLTGPDLCGNQFEDLAALSALINLTALSLSGTPDHSTNRIGDLTVLSDLVRLDTLTSAWNDLSDLAPLSPLARLSYLDLRGNRISDISIAENWSNLPYLDISRNDDSDIDPLVQNSGIGRRGRNPDSRSLPLRRSPVLERAGRRAFLSVTRSFLQVMRSFL